jgi:hypothetical protein
MSTFNYSFTLPTLSIVHFPLSHFEWCFLSTFSRNISINSIDSDEQMTSMKLEAMTLAPWQQMWVGIIGQAKKEWQRKFYEDWDTGTFAWLDAYGSYVVLQRNNIDAPTWMMYRIYYPRLTTMTDDINVGIMTWHVWTTCPNHDQNGWIWSNFS